MTHQKDFTLPREILDLIAGQGFEYLPELIRLLLNAAMKAERQQHLQAEPYQRTEERQGHANGYKPKTLKTRVGPITFEIPQVREGGFYPGVLEKGLRSERALILALVEMYVQGVSTRKVKAITEELCGHRFSASTISQINKGLDETLSRFASRRLDEAYPYLILDARYEKVRIDGVIQSQAVLIAIGINGEGRRQVLGVALANRESGTSWKDFLQSLRQRGLSGVEFVVSDDHHGIKLALREMLPEAAWQRCYVHFLRNALDYLPRKADDDCLQELRWLYDRRDLKEAQQDLAAWLRRWEGRYPRLTDWAEEHIGETLTFYRLPRQHHKHMKSTNLLERLNEEIKRRTRVVRIFPNPATCLRLVLALCTETHETWLEDHRYIKTDLLKEQKKEQLREAA